MQANKSIVLLSAGLDSTVNLHEALLHSRVELALTFNYGQRAAAAEIRCSQDICANLGLSHKVVKLPFMKEFGKSALLTPEVSIPKGREVQINSLETSEATAKAVWVPNRNGIFLNVAAGFAEALAANWIVPGFNIEEAQTFPDNSADFLRATTQALGYSTANRVVAQCFTLSMTKPQIVRRGLDLKVDFAQTWPCYLDGEKWCGQCESCLRARRAFDQCGLQRCDLKYGPEEFE